jgi:hypothetical protein
LQLREFPIETIALRLVIVKAHISLLSCKGSDVNEVVEGMVEELLYLCKRCRSPAVALPPFPAICYHPDMNDQAQILRELRESIAEALRRSEERMSHVQRQLAGWAAPIAKSTPLSDSSAGWEQLEAQASEFTDSVDQELSSVQTSLTELVQFGRQMKVSVAK